MKPLQTERLPFVILFVLFAIILGCGGTQKEGAGEYDCKTAIEDLQHTSKSDLCTFASIERMELQIHSLKTDCGNAFDDALDRSIRKKLFHAQKCVEKEQALAPLRSACSTHLEALDKQKDCLNNACRTAITNALEVIHNCSAKVLGGTYVTEANHWIAIFKERVAEGDRLKSLVHLKAECDSAMANVNQVTASHILERIVKLIHNTDGLQQKHPIESQMARSAQRALASCEGPLRGSVEWIAATYADELNRKEIRNDKGRKRRRLKRLQIKRTQLMEIDAPTRYPNIEAPLTALLSSFDKKPSAPEPQKTATRPPATTLQNQHVDNSTPVNNVQPDSSQQGISLKNENDTRPKKASRKCRKLTKKSRKYTSKVNEYKRKKNKRKVSAYQKKLNKARTQMVQLFCDPM